MSSNPEFLRRWIGEFCAPVVVTLATAEAEKTCLQNGLLFHELLSCFGHLVDINVNIRIGKQALNITETHLRFERATEAKPKTSDNMESVLNSNFTAFDINRLPVSVPELKSSPPTAWTNTVEQLVARSMSFSEFEMLSHPLIVMTVVSSSDADPLSAMQELTSIHHTPACFTNGQYDPSVQRVFVLLDDASTRQKDPLIILRSLQNYFPTASTKLLTINTLPVTNPNLHQPDMWSRYLIPKFFPQHAPSVDLSKVLPISQTTQQPVIGCRLSGDDFMKLQDFCVWLFSEQIAPHVERRLAILSNQVNETKKGMKNVLKSFWRKPRDESDFSRGGVKYRYDKIETQIMLLADMSFMIKDYETALSMYRLVKDDYKSDKSNLHFAQTTLMICVCQMLTEPHKYKEIYGQLEIIGQCIGGGLEVPHAAMYLALLCSELYTFHNNYRAPLESAKILLIAATTLSSRYPLQSSLLMERAANFFLQGNQTRKYVLHQVLAGNKLFKCGTQPAKHAAICFAVSLVILEKSAWADIKAKLAKALTRDLKNGTSDGARRSLLFMLKMLFIALKDGNEFQDSAALMDAVSVLNEIQSNSLWGNLRVREGWSSIPTREILLGSVPVEPFSELVTTSVVEICDFPVPNINPATVRLIEPTNGVFSLSSAVGLAAADLLERDRLLRLYHVERNWVEEQRQVGSAPDANGTNNSNQDDRPPVKSLHERWVKALNELESGGNGKDTSMDTASKLHRVPLGERLYVTATLHNKLPVDVALSKLRCLLEPAEAFELHETKQTIHPDESVEVTLTASPKVVGRYELNTLGWNIGDNLSVRQSVAKQGPLLQKTQQQRSSGARGVDRSLHFEVVAEEPLLGMVFEGLSPEVLQGQLLKATLVLRNYGAAPARDIYLKMSNPSFVFYLNRPDLTGGQIMDFCGQSCTLVHLAEVVVQPGKEVRLDAWIRMVQPGVQKVHLLAVYYNANTDITTTSSPRTSFVSVQTTCLPSLALRVQLTSASHSSIASTMLVETSNLLSASSDSVMDRSELRLSSFGQIDIMDSSSDFADVDENAAKVLSTLLLGAANESSGIKPVRKILNNSTARPSLGIHVLPGERFSRCYALQSTSSSSCSSWLLPLPSEAHATFARASSLSLSEIVECFLYIWYSTEHFARELAIARQLWLEEELQASEAGPRSIAEVRRHRQRMQEEQERLRGLDNPLGSTSSASPASTVRLSSVVQSLQEAAEAEHRRLSLGLALLWVSRWQGKIRWGLHHVSNIRPAARTSASQPASSQHLVVTAVQHAGSVSLSSLVHDEVTITVEIRSLAARPLWVSLLASSSLVQSVGGSSNAEIATQNNQSCMWRGKVRVEDIALPAQAVVRCAFTLTCLQPGVIDVNRFSVRVREEGDSSTEDFVRVPGQSLLTVLA